MIEPAIAPTSDERGTRRLRFTAMALVGFGVVLAVSALWLAWRNDSYARDPSIFLSILMVFTYAAVGALLASRLPRNPIGWLFLIAGLGLLFGGATNEYATNALTVSPGNLPFGEMAAWLGTWAFASIGAIPLILALFPTGRVPSPRWRWLPWTIVAATAGLAVVGMFGPGSIDVSEGSTIDNPFGIEAFEPLLAPLTWVAGVALLGSSIAAAVALVVRYRRSVAEERQQLRWFATMAAVTGAFLVAVVVTTIGLESGESSPINTIALFLFGVCVGIGIPATCAIAVLKFHLWDLDVVIKKTLVFALLVGFVMLAGFAVAVITTYAASEALFENPSWLLLAGLGIGWLTVPLYRIARRVADRLVYGGRATSYEVLTSFSGRLADTYATDDVLPRMASILAQGAGAESLTIWLLVGGASIPAATWPPDTDGPATGSQPFDVRHQGELLGTITVTMPANDPMSPTKERLVRDFAGQAGLVLRNVRLIEELRASSRRLVTAQDAERRRLERNIHDGAQQQLVALAVQLRLAEQMLDRDPAQTKNLLRELQGSTTDALEDLRDLARGIYPPLLADRGLAEALQAQAKKAPVPVTVDADGLGRFDQEVEAAVYFSCLEALQNVAKYAEAGAALVTVTNDNGDLRFRVTDDGKGFDTAGADRGTGLQGMADRLTALGGELAVRSAPGAGTTVEGRLPVAVAS